MSDVIVIGSLSNKCTIRRHTGVTDIRLPKNHPGALQLVAGETVIAAYSTYAWNTAYFENSHTKEVSDG